MTQKNFNKVVSALFAVIFVVHALRLFYGWVVTIDGWSAPMWISWFGLALAGFLSWSAYKLSK